MTPSPIAFGSLARLVPSLDEIVVDVDGRWSTHLHVHIMLLSLAAMSGNAHRVRVETDPADERGFALGLDIDEPGFLMLAKPGMRSVPANLQPRLSAIEPRPLLGGPPECVPTVSFARGVRSPEEDADVDPSRCRSIEDVERASSAIRHLERRPHERYGEPDIVLGPLDGFTNPPKSGSPIDE